MILKKNYYIGILIIILTSACSSQRIITQKRADQIAHILCIPKTLPVELNPTPEFYWVGDDIDLPDLGIVYRGNNNSSHLLYIFTFNLTYSIRPAERDEDVRKFYSPQYCPDKFTITGSSYFYPICESTQIRPLADDDKQIIVEDPSFITSFSWLVNKDEYWTFYHVRSTLSTEKTKQIVESMCLE